MKRRTLDVLFSTGGALLAILLVVMGLVMVNRSDFSKNYVRNQLTQQDIAFPAVSTLTPQDKQFAQSHTGCVIKYAEQTVTNGKQAECYANEYLGSHVTYLATRLGMPQVAFVDGQNYRQLGATLSSLKAQAAAEDAAGRPTATLNAQIADVTTVRTKMFEGTMLRNALLTSYGFGSLGDLAGTGAVIAFIAAGVLALLAIAGFVHAWFTPSTKPFAPIEPAGKDLVGS